MAFESKVEDSPREIILSALIRTNGFVIRAAHQLGIPRRTFYRRLDELRLWPAINKLRRLRAQQSMQDAEISKLADAHAV